MSVCLSVWVCICVCTCMCMCMGMCVYVYFVDLPVPLLPFLTDRHRSDSCSGPPAQRHSRGRGAWSSGFLDTFNRGDIGSLLAERQLPW